MFFNRNTASTLPWFILFFHQLHSMYESAEHLSSLIRVNFLELDADWPLITFASKVRRSSTPSSTLCVLITRTQYVSWWATAATVKEERESVNRGKEVVDKPPSLIKLIMNGLQSGKRVRSSSFTFTHRYYHRPDGDDDEDDSHYRAW